jgi:hypothetical protein
MCRILRLERPRREAERGREFTGAPSETGCAARPLAPCRREDRATGARPTPAVRGPARAAQVPPYRASQAFIRSFRLAASLLM